MDKAILIAELIILICLFLRNYEIACKISELEERIEVLERQMVISTKWEKYPLWEVADDEDN